MSTSSRPEHIGPEDYPESTSIPSAESLVGAPVADSAGNEIGTVEAVFVDLDGRYVRYLAIATGWSGTQHQVLPVDDMRHEEGAVRVPYSDDELREAPRYDPGEDIHDEREREVYGHYGRTGYWEAVRARQEVPAVTPEVARAEGYRGDDLAAHQNIPAPTPEVAEAEVRAAIDRGDDPRMIRVKRWGI